VDDWPLDILLVEDDEAHAELIRRVFEPYADRYRLRSASTLAGARAHLAAQRPDLALADLLLPDGRGVELLPDVAVPHPFPVIIMTSHGSERVAVEALKAGALDYVVKSPTALADLPRTVERALREWGHLVERRRAEAALQRSERRFRALIEHSSDVVSIVDADGLIRYSSPATTRILGYPLAEYVGRNLFDLIHPDDVEKASALFAQLLAQPAASLTFELRLLHHDGAWRWIDATSTNRLADPAAEGLIVNYRDITERKQAELRLQHDALHDALTGLPNRLLLTDRLEQAIRRAGRREDDRFAVLFLDLDHFKVVNDSLGHTIGDQLLIALAPRLERCLRAADTCARLGGDEFVILLEGIQDADDAIHVAERIQAQLAEPFDLNGLMVVASASIGIVLSTVGYERPEDVLRDADIAMYRAKGEGKARYQVFDVSMRARVLARLSLEAELRRALDQREMRVYYEPIIALSTGALAGFEALARWQHPERGLIMPADFIPVAEESALIVAIDRWVLREACRRMRAWQSGRPADAGLAINVNLSGRQFTRPDLAEQVEQALRETGLAADCLRLEITESMIMENLDYAAQVLRRLHRLGVKIAIDDFGTGYSSLGYLTQLPIDILKIDRRFVGRLESGEGQAEIVTTIVTLAHNLGLTVIAEGLETPRQYQRLKALGCEFGQGYLIARPMDSAAAEALIAAWTDRPFTPPPA